MADRFYLYNSFKLEKSQEKMLKKEDFAFKRRKVM
jgi:hypothetical protein